MDRKSAKEAFVAGLEGTSQAEVFALVSTLSLSVVVCEQITDARHPKVRLALELLTVYLQVLLYTGALPPWPSSIACFCVASAGTMLVYVRAARGECAGLPSAKDLAGSRKSFVSLFRGALMAATCVCILAVDFRAFPRRYAKTEYYGTGYMDVGVGGVVLTAGLVSPISLPYKCGDGRDGKEERWRPEPFVRRLYGGLRGAAACWLLGLARLVSTRALDYQAHVGEYGVHWNFFDTIAVVALLGNVVAVPPAALAPAAVAVTAVHQIALSAGGLGPWVMSPDRSPDLLSLNKEGIVSCTGFWALYLWGAALAHLMHTTLQPAVRQLHVHAARSCQGHTAGIGRVGGKNAGAGQRDSALEYPGGPRGRGAADEGGSDGAARGGERSGEGGGGGARAAIEGCGVDERTHRVHLAVAMAAAAPLLRWWLQLVAVDTALWAAVFLLESRVERVSRRSCNAAYITWIVAQCLAGMLPLALWQALATAIGACPAAAAAGSGGAVAVRVTQDDRIVEGECGHAARAAGGEEQAALDLRRQRQRRDEAASREVAPVGPPAEAPCRAGAGGWGPRVLLATNRNQLAVFLLANLLTGAVNLSIDTLQVTVWPARLLLGVYMTCVSGAALVLDHFGWRVKL